MYRCINILCVCVSAYLCQCVFVSMCVCLCALHVVPCVLLLTVSNMNIKCQTFCLLTLM